MRQLINFNPRLRKGDDRREIDTRSKNQRFQSTSPQGRRLHSGIFKSIYSNFNPRLRKGDDLFIFIPKSFKAYFNPRLRKGDDITQINNGC